ncbi:MAG: UDP-glucose/GDP-mannose dehydrogenase family protein, partial [Actinobacteria bacterium]
MSKVAVIGLGFVGLTTALGFAAKGHEVAGVESGERRRADLEAGRVPFHEPGLAEALADCLGDTFAVTGDLAGAVRGADAVFVCVGTPSGDDGAADLTHLDAAVAQVLDAVRDEAVKPVLVVKSTVPPGTTAGHVAGLVAGTGVPVAANPEFLREGVAWDDFMHPDRIVIGCEDPRAAEVLQRLYDAFDADVCVVSLTTAEFIKYLSNTLLATLVSYANEMSMIADGLGDVDVPAAFRILHRDRRWSGHPAAMASYAYPGAGFGGYCLPKDTAALAARARMLGVEPRILDGVLAVNVAIAEHVADRIAEAAGGGVVSLLGLAFKPGSDDVREAPTAAVVRALAARGVARLLAYDPMAA